MKRTTLRSLVPALAILALLLPSQAQARTYKCVPGSHLRGYQVGGGFPGVGKLRATLPRRIDGVATPCLIADMIAGGIQNGYANNQRFPSTLVISDEDFNAGEFICVYRERRTVEDTTYATARCHQNGKKHRYVTMDLYS